MILIFQSCKVICAPTTAGKSSTSTEISLNGFHFFLSMMLLQIDSRCCSTFSASIVSSLMVIQHRLLVYAPGEKIIFQNQIVSVQTCVLLSEAGLPASLDHWRWQRYIQNYVFPVFPAGAA